MRSFSDGADIAVSNVAARGGDNVIVRKFNHSQPTVASTHRGPTQEAQSGQAAGQIGQQPETHKGSAVQAPSRAPRAPSCYAAQAEPALAAQYAQQSPRHQAEGDLGPQPGTFTPFEALQIVQAEWAANGPVFAEPLEDVLAHLGHKPEPDARQARLLAFIDSCEPRVEALLHQAMQAGADPQDLLALLSDGTVLPPYQTWSPVPRWRLKSPSCLGKSTSIFFITSGPGPPRASCWRSCCLRACRRYRSSPTASLGTSGRRRRRQRR